MFIDASEKGYEGFIASRFNGRICCTKSNQNKKQTSSTYRPIGNYLLLNMSYPVLVTVSKTNPFK